MVDMAFFVGEQVSEQVTSDVILDLFAIFDGLDVIIAPVMLDLEVALEHFADVFTNVQFAEVLQVGDAFEKQDAVDQLLGMLHLFDGLIVLPLGQLLQAPVLIHLGMQKILVDGYQLIAESLVEMLDNLGVAFHCVLSLSLSRRTTRLISLILSSVKHAVSNSAKRKKNQPGQSVG